MNGSQKRFLELPLLILIFWITQSLELYLFQLPWSLGGVHFAPILIVYITLTRSWLALTLLNLVIAVMGSFNVGYSAGIFIASQLWTAFVMKIVVQEFALEGRRAFTLLAFGASVFAKALTWILLNRAGAALPLTTMTVSVLAISTATALAAWIIYPIMLWWDEFFDHPTQENELNSGLR